MTKIIVGAGITGLYLAYKLIKYKDINPNDILIIEKSDRVGGRIYTYQNKGYKYDVGAGRLGKKQKLVMKLIKEFNLTDKIYDITGDKNYFVDNKLLNEKELLKYYNSKFSSISKLWKYVIDYKSNLDLTKMNFHNYISTFLSTNEVKILDRSLGYVNEIYRLNAYDAIYTLKKDFDVEDNSFFILMGGLSIIYEKIHDFLKEKNVKIILNCDLLDIDDKNKTIKTNKENYKYSELYLAICKKGYMTIPYFTKYKELLDSVSVGNLLRIYAKYDVKKNKWIKDIKKTLTDNKLQFIIPIDNKSGLIQISYTDDYIANFWNILTTKQIKINLVKYLKEIFPNENVTEPEWITKHYWCCGAHFWKVGKNSRKIQKQIEKTFKPKKIYVIGEIYSSRQAWIEGSLETVEKLFK